VRKGWAERSFCGQPAYLVDDTVLSADIRLSDPRELAFVEHVPRFIALDGPLRRVEGPNPQPRIHETFHKPVILLYPIIQILALSEPTGLWACAVLLEGVAGWWVRRVLVDGEHTGRARMCVPQHLAAAALSCIGITGGA